VELTGRHKGLGIIDMPHNKSINQSNQLKIELNKSLKIIDVLWNDIAEVRCSTGVANTNSDASCGIIGDSTILGAFDISRKAGPLIKIKSNRADCNNSNNYTNNNSNDSTRNGHNNIDCSNINESIRISESRPGNSNDDSTSHFNENTISSSNDGTGKSINTDIIDKINDASNDQCFKETLESSVIAFEQSTLSNNDVGRKNKRKKQKLNLRIENNNSENQNNLKINNKYNKMEKTSIMNSNGDIADMNATYLNDENIYSTTQPSNMQNGESANVMHNDNLQIEENKTAVFDCSSFSFMDLFSDELSQRRNEVIYS
jgi:hypothetical protein